MRLTKATVAKLALPPGKAEAIFFDDDMPGFGIRIRAGGKKTWVAQYRFGAKQRRISLGSPATLPAEQARAEAAKLLSAVTLGSDPQTTKQEARQRAAVTFGSLVPLYLAHAESRQKAAYHADVGRYLKTHWAPLFDVPIDKVSRALVAKNLGDLRQSRGAYSADRARANLSGFFGWAIGEGLATENPVVGTNRPVDAVSRDRVLADEEVRIIWRALPGGAFGSIVKLLILTGCRRDEVAGMACRERQDALWIIPAERTKNSRPHEVPLSPLALAILDAVPRQAGRENVFGTGAAGFSGWSKSKARLDERIAAALGHELPGWRLHDLRRTAATRMADLGVAPHVVEAVLNHVSGHRAGVAGIYNRAAYREEKRTALALWAAHVAALVEDRA